MQSGKLRHRFTIQTYTDSLNDYGENTPPTGDDEWETFDKRWGSLNAVNLVSGDEEEKAEKVMSQVPFDIRIRYLSGLIPKMRFKLGARYFNIERILPDPTNERQQLIRVKEKLD